MNKFRDVSRLRRTRELRAGLERGLALFGLKISVPASDDARLADSLIGRWEEVVLREWGDLLSANAIRFLKSHDIGELSSVVERVLPSVPQRRRLLVPLADVGVGTIVTSGMPSATALDWLTRWQESGVLFCYESDTMFCLLSWLDDEGSYELQVVDRSQYR